MPYAKDDLRLVFMPESEILNGKGICDVMRGRWFAVCPERGLIFWQPDGRRKGQLRGASPQCNGDHSIALRIISPSFPWAVIKRFDVVMLPVNVSDYA